MPAIKRYQSDVIVDLIKSYGFPHIALNPGASFRGLHDSLVNYGNNEPAMILCQHEKIAVQIAHGYAKVTGRPMIAIVHDLVGMLHATLGIYTAYMDRAPVFVIGATGPMDESKRRPFIDWIHSANVQGNALRDYVKWDYQPHSVHGFADSFARAYSIMMTQPQGPIYMCYDAWLQEAPLTESVVLPAPSAMHVPSLMAPEKDALAALADRLLAARWPVLIAEYVGRSPNGFSSMVALAETLGAPVHDVNARLNFPSRHPLNLTFDRDVFRFADAVLCLDVRDWEKPTHVTHSATREFEALVPEGAEWMEIGFGDLEVSKWSMDYQRMPKSTHRVLGDTELAIPALVDLLRERIAKDDGLRTRIEERRGECAKRHEAMRARIRSHIDADWTGTPTSVPRLASEVWEVIKEYDWVLTAGTLNDWTHRIWDFDRPYRHAGRNLGTSTQIGISLGVALAHKGTGRLVIDMQPDGDLMFDLGALWTAAKYDIPILFVMFNNRAYYNDWEHQIHLAEMRQTDPTRAHIGQDIDGPPPDFATVAKGLGLYAEGPIEKPEEIGPALRRAIEVVMSGKPALIDTVTRHR